MASKPAIVNTTVFPLNGVLPPAPASRTITGTAVTRAATY